MRVVAWNIRAGGGRRVGAIARQLEAWQPDIVALSEFRGTAASTELAALLAHSGLGHQRCSANRKSPADNELLIASRWPVQPIRLPCGPAEPGRWLAVRVDGPVSLAMLGLHIPLGRERKGLYMDAVLRTMRRWRRRAGLIVGDTNSGRPDIDEESPVFDARHGAWFDAIDALGWRDCFRHLHPASREFTWYSPNGRNGFRLDQAFASPALAGRIRSVEHRWGEDGVALHRESVSDHAAVVVDIAVDEAESAQAAAQRGLPEVSCSGLTGGRPTGVRKRR